LDPTRQDTPPCRKLLTSQTATEKVAVFSHKHIAGLVSGWAANKPSFL
jgi:hypothetical protein